MREEKCAQNVPLVIYNIPKSLLKFGVPLIINPYSINKSINNKPIIDPKICSHIIFIVIIKFYFFDFVFIILFD